MMREIYVKTKVKIKVWSIDAHTLIKCHRIVGLLLYNTIVNMNQVVYRVFVACSAECVVLPNDTISRNEFGSNQLDPGLFVNSRNPF